MKTIYKQKLVEVEVFVAEDGKEFEDEDDCEYYEAGLLMKKVYAFDCNGKRTYDPEEAIYAYIPDKEALRAFNIASETHGTCLIDIDDGGYGWYMYMDTRFGGMRCINHIVNMIDKLRGEVS